MKTNKAYSYSSVNIIKPFYLYFICFLVACINHPGSDTTSTDNNDSITSPPLTAAESMKTMKLEDGFTIQLVAEEPMVNSPVALTFDSKGRIWVVEMEGYMPDTTGKGEDLPVGKIVILEDTNHDGRSDKRTIFLDSLVMPRAICLIEDGILIAEPPSLWFFKIENDHAAQKLLVDSEYAVGGNVEHQPNGLYRGFDNWIYNAEGGKRYKKKGNNWLIERMYRRGQWGISHDDYGRLFYNNNSANLLGDYFPPGFGPYNRNQPAPEGFNENIVPDNRVYPSHPTPGVNRGYQDQTLDDQKRLVNFTAASGPIIYRGDLFGKQYYGNAFVGGPAANIIKRNILINDGYKVSGHQAYREKEFLSSTDERFRPVTLYNGPDGALYVVDMYRGIIQHKTYLTEYLKNQIRVRKLTNPINCGRIYRIVPKNSKPVAVQFSEDPQQLAKLLKHSNGWVRDKAMQLIVDRKLTSLSPMIRGMLGRNSSNPSLVATALWTLEGLGSIQPTDVIPFLKHREWPLRMQGLSILPSVIGGKNYKQYEALLSEMFQHNDTLAFPFIAYIANSIAEYDKAYASRILFKLVQKYPDNKVIADAVISNFENRETGLQTKLRVLVPDTTLAINKRVSRLIRSIEERKKAGNVRLLRKEFPKGAQVFQSICQTCHGADGNGVHALAPPLNHSEWITGKKDRLIAIVLYGLSGPIQVNGKLYGPPEINGEMPALGGNDELSDEDLAQVMSFVRKSWSNNAGKITAEEVSAIRKKYKGRQKPFSAKELASF